VSGHTTLRSALPTPRLLVAYQLHVPVPPWELQDGVVGGLARARDLFRLRFPTGSPVRSAMVRRYRLCLVLG
jgi:hypothetical protein